MQYESMLIKMKWLIVLWLLSVIYAMKVSNLALKILLINIAGLSIITFVSLLLKPEEHVIFPIFSVLLLLNLIYIIDTGFFESYSYKHSIFLMIILIPSFAESYRQCKATNTEQDRANYYSSVAAYLKANPAKLTVLNIGSWDHGHHKMFQENVFSNLRNAYVLDGAKLYFNHDHQKIIETTTGSFSFIGQWEFFMKNKGCDFISTPERMSFILHYINIVYNKHFFAICKKQFPVLIDKQEPLAIFEVIESQ